MKSSLLTLLALCVLVTGCASTQQLSSADRAQLDEVRINPVIETVPQMYYLGPGSGIGFLFGPLGGAITAVSNMAPGEQLKKFAADNGVNIDGIVLQEATDAFRKSGKVRLTQTPGPKVATLNISIPLYGFSIPNGFSSKLVPIVDIRCTLVDADGKVIWRSSGATHPLGNPADGETLSDFRSDPKLMEASWRTAARAVMAGIVGNL